MSGSGQAIDPARCFNHGDTEITEKNGVRCEFGCVRWLAAQE